MSVAEIVLAKEPAINESPGIRNEAKSWRRLADQPVDAAGRSSRVVPTDQLMAGLDQPVDRATILALEPEPHAMLSQEGCDEAFLAIADMIDMRMPHTFGHSRAVAALTEAACKRAALPASDIRFAKWAAYTHDIGELAVPVSTWMRAGALTERETDATHLHPYHGERALASLGGDEGKAIAALVLRHHERLDGTGYHRYAKAPDLSPPPASLQPPKPFKRRGKRGPTVRR